MVQKMDVRKLWTLCCVCMNKNTWLCGLVCVFTVSVKLNTWMSLSAIRRHQRLCPRQDRRLQQPSARWAPPSAGSSRIWGTHHVVPLYQSGSPVLIHSISGVFICILLNHVKLHKVTISQGLVSLPLYAFFSAAKRGRVRSELNSASACLGYQSLNVFLFEWCCRNTEYTWRRLENILLVARRIFYKQITEFCLMVPAWLV